VNIIIISIQPEGRLWQEPEPSQVTGMALAHCILGSFLGVGCHCFPPPLDVPTFASRCLNVNYSNETILSIFQYKLSQYLLTLSFSTYDAVYTDQLQCV
jgi:hypothetical protein